MEQRRFLSGMAAIALVFLTVSLAVSPGTAQCFNTSNCTGTQVPAPGNTTEDCCVGTSGGVSFRNGSGVCEECIGAAQCFSTLACGPGEPTVSAPGNTIEDCCLGTDEGLIYLASDGVEGCRSCIVFGWIDGSDFVGNETNEPYRLEIGFIKGMDLFDNTLLLRFSVTVTPGSAGQGANADFTVTNLNPDYRRASSTNPAVSAILRVDDLAQEFDETFQLTLVQNPPNPALDFEGTNEFLLDTLTVTIIDQEVVTFIFAESDYSDPEEGEEVEVTLRRTTAIANPVIVRIVPLNYTEYLETGIMANLPNVEDENPFTPNRAKSLPLDRRDFNITPIEVIFDANADSSFDILVPIPIFDDEINEVEEVFVAILELANAVNPNRVVANTATLCRITDNDDIFITFERDEYRFNESDVTFVPNDSPILIVKEDGDGNDRESEQIFRVSITAGVADRPGTGNAQFRPTFTDDGDYSLGQPVQTLIELFLPEDQSFGFQFQIFDDNVLEGPETFGLTIATTTGEGGVFRVGTIGSTVVIIEDNDNVIVGFEDTSVTANETDLRAELCVKVFVPDDDEDLLINFFLDPTTVPGTADETDYVPFTLFNNPLIVAQFGQDLRRFCFDVTINDDSLFELTESFTVTLGLGFGSPQSGIILDPAEAVITIIDDDAVTIGFSPDEYRGLESAGFATLNIAVLSGSVGTIIGLDLSTIDGSALDTEDYGAIAAQGVTFTPTGPSSIQVNVTITDDDRFEAFEENFQASLTLVSPVNIIRQDAITISPDLADIVILDEDGIVIGFDPPDYAELESVGVVDVTIRLLSGSLVGSSIAVNISSTDGTAALGLDYNFTPQTLTFDQSNTNFTIQVTILNDNLTELSEIFYLNATSLEGRVQLIPGSASVTIIDNDIAVIGFAPFEYNVNEDAGFVDLTITVLQGELAETVLVDFSTQDGTALAGIDYTSRNLQLGFIGTETQIVTVNITVDAFLEFDETFFANLVLAPTNLDVVVDPSTANITIVNDDVVVIGFEQPSYVTSETNATSDITVYAIVQNGSLLRDVEVTAFTQDGSALAGSDYSSVIQQILTFNQNNTRFPLTIPILGDDINEPDESFEARLSTTDSDATLNPQSTTITINDNDPVVFAFGQAMYLFVENAVTGQVCVEKNGSTTQTLRVRINGGLQPGLGAFDQVLTFAPDDTEMCVDIPIGDDQIALEEIETLTFTLTVVDVLPNVMVGDPDMANVGIMDDDELVITLVTDDVIPEAIRDAMVQILFDKAYATEFDVRVVSGDNVTFPATPDIDYGRIDRVVTASPNNMSNTTRSFPFPIADDNLVEELLEGITFEISLPSGTPDLVSSMVRFQVSRTTSSIQDDDFVTIGFDPDTYSVEESGGAVFINVTVISGELERAVEVSFFLANGTAMSPMDYQDTGEFSLQFDSIITTRTVRVLIEDDNVLEDDESFFARLTTADSAVILGPDMSEINITEDNDEVTIGFRPTEYDVVENEGSVTLTVVVLNGQLAREVAVQFFTSPGIAASPNDYDDLDILLTFNSVVSMRTVTVTINDDDIVETNETFFGNLENPLTHRVTLDPESAIVTITDADDTVTIGFGQTIYTTGEGMQVEVCVSVVSGTLERDVAVTLSSSDDTASAGTDYDAISEDLVFSASVTEICQNVTTLSDDNLESDETFNLTLTTTDDDVILDPEEAVVIIENDDFVTIGLEETRYDVDEGEVVEVCAVLISGTLERETVVTLQTSDGSATSTAPEDYVPANVDLTFDAMTNRTCAIVSTIEDDIYELEEEFNVTLTTEDSFVVLDPMQGVVGVTDDDTLRIGFERITYVTNETSGSVEICAVVLDNGVTEIPVEVQFQTSDGSAMAGDDYIATSVELTFEPGDSRECTMIPIINDGTLEGPEDFFGNLNTSFVNVILDPDQTTIFIADVDSIMIGFIGVAYPVNESAGAVDLEVGLISGSLSKDIVVRLFTEDGTATAPGDYGSTEILLTFNATVSTLFIPVVIVNDAIDEDPEQFFGRLELVTVASVIVSPDTATVTIVDDDGVTIGLEEPEIVVPEGAGPVEVCVALLEGQLERDVIVTLSTSDGSAVAPDDYTNTTVDLTFNGNNTRECVDIPIVDDDVFEGNETINVILTSGDPDTTLDPSDGTISIEDDEMITLGFESANYTINEPDGPQEVCVVSSGAIGTNLPAINFVYSDETAEDGSDYIATPVTLFFGPGDTILCEDVTIINDTVLEVLNENFRIDLESTGNSAEDQELLSRIMFSPLFSVVTIVDDDSVTIGFNQTTYVVQESSGQVTVSVSVLMGDLEQEIEVRLLSLDGTARSPGDYQVIDVILTFGPGAATRNIDIVIVNDSADEENMENFFSILQLVTIRDNVVISPDQATITIIDDDQIQIGLENTTYTVMEDGGFVEICAVIMGSVTLERQAIVTLTTSDDTATDGEDYIGIAVNLTFNQNISRACADVPIANDTIREGSESFNITVTPGDPDIIAVPPMGVVVITDDDVVAVRFRQPSYTFTEDGVTGTIEIEKTGIAAAPFDIFVSGGPSVQTDVNVSADGISETVTFGAGPTADNIISISFDITDDDVGLEAVESYIASLQLIVPDGILVERNTTVINIEDDDDVTVRFGSPRVTVAEGDLMFTMCVVKNIETIGPVTVTIEDQAGTATRDIDYDSASIPMNVTIPGDELSACFTGDIVDDMIAAEFTENFFLNIVGVPDEVTVVLDRTEIAITDDDSAVVSFVEPTYTVREGVAVEVCVMKDLETAIPTSVNLETEDNTAESPGDYIGGTFTAQFGTEAGAIYCQSIPTVLDTDVETDDEDFLVNIVTIPGSPLRPGDPAMTTVTITGFGVQVNDTVIGDPLMTVPIHAPDSDFDDISLCYEIHGADDEYFNLVTDECTSVNAHYGAVTDYLNVADEIAIRAVDNSDGCRNVTIDLAGNCSVQIDGMPFTARTYSNQGINVRRYRNRVRVAVPNCEELTLVMWIFCETNTLQDPFDGSAVVADMIKFVVMRGLNFGHRNAHGLIGQFWNQPVTLTNYTGLLTDGSQAENRYIINFTRPGSEPRAFTGYFYELTWDFKDGPCLYVGNRQAGPIAEVDDPNDSVIEGSYRDYQVAEAFQTDYVFGQFSEDRCRAGSASGSGI